MKSVGKLLISYFLDFTDTQRKSIKGNVGFLRENKTHDSIQKKDVFQKKTNCKNSFSKEKEEVLTDIKIPYQK